MGLVAVTAPGTSEPRSIESLGDLVRHAGRVVRLFVLRQGGHGAAVPASAVHCTTRARRASRTRRRPSRDRGRVAGSPPSRIGRWSTQPRRCRTNRRGSRPRGRSPHALTAPCSVLTTMASHSRCDGRARRRSRGRRAPARGQRARGRSARTPRPAIPRGAARTRRSRRSARSRTSRESRLALLVAPSPHVMQPPAIPGRLSSTVTPVIPRSSASRASVRPRAAANELAERRPDS